MKNKTDKVKKGLAVVNATEAGRLASGSVNFFPGTLTARSDYDTAALGPETKTMSAKYARPTGQKSTKNEGDGLTVWLLGLIAMERIYANLHPAPKNEIS